MAESTGTRRLQAIMFTDIAGFSAMMGANEQQTVGLVIEHRELVRQALAAHDGVEHEIIGDAFLALFDSPVNALHCAIDIQQQLFDRNQDRPTPEQVWLRIGLHLADILHRDGAIYGDGVNAAARIQGIAEPGCVVMSEPMRLHTEGKVKVGMTALGVRELKGIAVAPALFALQLQTERGLQGTERIAQSARAGRQLVYAALALVVVVGGAFAINSGFSKAEEGNKRAQLGDDAATSTSNAALGPTALQAADQAAAAQKRADYAAQVEANEKAATAEKAASRAKAQVEAMSEVMHQAAAAKVSEALATTGNARVKLMQEALTLDPDNAAIGTLLMTARADAQRADAERAQAAKAPKRAPAADTPTEAVPTSKPPVRAIRPRVIED
jgi:class 3 adenylate cyclase